MNCMVDSKENYKFDVGVKGLTVNWLSNNSGITLSECDHVTWTVVRQKLHAEIAHRNFTQCTLFHVVRSLQGVNEDGQDLKDLKWSVRIENNEKLEKEGSQFFIVL